MERRFNQSKTNLFNLVKNSKLNDINILNSKAITSSIQKDRKEYINLIDTLASLQSKVLLPGHNIDALVSTIEMCLENKTNDKGIIISLFTSRLFLDILNAYNISLKEYQEKLLNLIEKLLQNKTIGHYLSKNQNILPKILKYIIQPKVLETSIKILETLLMSGQNLYPMNKMCNEINEIYSYMEFKDRLDTFCRILAILIFDYKKMEYTQMFKEKEILRIKPLTKITSENQTICLHFNNFFENIINKLRKRLEKTKIMANNIEISRNIINYIISGDNDIDINEDDIGITLLIKNKTEKQKQIDSPYTDNELTEQELTKVLHLNPFYSFNPDFTKIAKNIDNIYNTYMKITNYLSSIQNKTKIQATKKHYITIFKYSTYQIEMLFVLSTLLCSKRKVEIQNKIGSLNIIRILDSYIEYMEWGNIFSNNKRPFFNYQPTNTQDETAYHGEGCCCDSDTALKSQYLRLIYSFCCRDDDNVENKLKLFVQKDIDTFLNSGYLQILQSILKEKYQIYKELEKKGVVSFSKDFINLYDKVNKSTSKLLSYDNIESLLLNLISLKTFSEKINQYNENDNNIGLLHKLIYKYMRECYYSSSKFWLSSCIEIILRGNNTFFQTYIGCSGLFPCLLYDILYSHKDQNQILQLSFDILGELIKFNRGNFYILTYYFSDSNERNEFLKKILLKESLVDSNVLLRSIILSNYFFDKHDEQSGLIKEEYFTNKCSLCKYIKEKLSIIFTMLITIILPDNVNQTNISCVNSALLILTLEYLKGTLSQFLNELRQKDNKEINDGILNFQKLLIMWKKFYNFRPKDAASLYHSTTIPFNTLQEVATTLLSKDPNNQMSLYYK